MEKKWIYRKNEDNSARYLLGEAGERPLFCLGINPSTAAKEKHDRTTRRVQAIARHNGYDGWVMLNVYPMRDTKFEELSLDFQADEHRSNVDAIKEVLKPYSSITVWVAFGDHLYGRAYLRSCLKEIYEEVKGMKVEWVATGVNKSGTPKHPLYQKNTAPLVSFDMKTFMERL